MLRKWRDPTILHTLGVGLRTVLDKGISLLALIYDVIATLIRDGWNQLHNLNWENIKQVLKRGGEHETKCLY